MDEGPFVVISPGWDWFEDSECWDGVPDLCSKALLSVEVVTGGLMLWVTIVLESPALDAAGLVSSFCCCMDSEEAGLAPVFGRTPD